MILQEYIHRVIKPTNKQDELVQGIQQFWATVDVQKCRRYIGHLRRVSPRIVELNGMLLVSRSGVPPGKQWFYLQLLCFQVVFCLFACAFFFFEVVDALILVHPCVMIFVGIK